MMSLTVYGQTDVGLVRPSNEDDFVIADLTGRNLIRGQIARLEVGVRGVLLAVSDGMGGERAGEVASALVVASLVRSMDANPIQQPHALVEAAVEMANREVWQAAQKPGREKMGATLTAVFVQGTSMHIAEVGDSRAYLLREGTLVQLTHDQSYVQTLVDLGAMTREEAEHNPMKNVILQAMGSKSAVTVALGKLSLRQRDCILICSDGLSNMVSAAEIKQVLLTSSRMDLACSALIELAKKHGGGDNITVILAAVSGDVAPLVAGEDISTTLEILKEFPAPSQHA
jgi:serine/threonine protein phosphatase PrpC